MDLLFGTIYWDYVPYLPHNYRNSPPGADSSALDGALFGSKSFGTAFESSAASLQRRIGNPAHPPPPHIRTPKHVWPRVPSPALKAAS